MEEQAGLSTKDAQYAICQGTYGGRGWTAQEKQTACERYQNMNSAHNNSNGLSVIAAVTIIVCIIAAVVAYIILYGKRSSQKRVKSPRKNKK